MPVCRCRKSGNGAGSLRLKEARCLPCNVVVQEASDGGVTVSIADPRAMFLLVNNPRLTPVVEDADQRLRRVIASLDLS